MTMQRRWLLFGIVVALMLIWGDSTMVSAQPFTGSEAATPAGQSGDDSSFLAWMIEASGPIGLVLLLMSFYLVAVVVWMFLEYRRSVALPDRLLHDVNHLLAQKNYPQAYERLANDSSFLGRVLAAGVRKLPSGQPAAQRAMHMVNDDVTMEMEHRTTYLSTVGTLGPLIGLLGTVYGMIIAFRVMSTEGEPQASQLAGGISTALFATLEGIALAIPAISFYAIFRNRIARLSLEVELVAESLLEQFAPGIRPVHPLATTVVSGPPKTSIGGPPKED